MKITSARVNRQLYQYNTIHDLDVVMFRQLCSKLIDEMTIDELKLMFKLKKLDGDSLPEMDEFERNRFFEYLSPQELIEYKVSTRI